MCKKDYIRFSVILLVIALGVSRAMDSLVKPGDLIHKSKIYQLRWHKGHVYGYGQSTKWCLPWFTLWEAIDLGTPSEARKVYPLLEDKINKVCK